MNLDKQDQLKIKFRLKITQSSESGRKCAQYSCKEEKNYRYNCHEGNTHGYRFQHDESIIATDAEHIFFASASTSFLRLVANEILNTGCEHITHVARVYILYLIFICQF